MSAEATIAKSTSVLQATGAKLTAAAGKLGAGAKLKIAAKLLSKKLATKAIVVTTAGMLTITPMVNAQSTHGGSGGGSGGGTTTSGPSDSGKGGSGGSGSGDSSGSSGSSKSTSTAKKTPVTAATVLKDSGGVLGTFFGLHPKTGKLVTAGSTTQKIGQDVSDINPLVGAGIEAAGAILELLQPGPKTTADKVKDVVKGGESVLHASRAKGQGQGEVPADMIKAAAALNTLSNASNPPPALKNLITAYQKATLAGPDTKLAADLSVVVAYEKLMQANGFQITDAQRTAIANALAKMQTMTDEQTIGQYKTALTHFENFVRDSQDATGTPLNDLTEAIRAFAKADISPTRGPSARAFGASVGAGDHVYNAAVALSAYKTAQANNDATAMAKYMATIFAEGQAAVQAQHPGYKVIAIDPDAIAAAVASANGAAASTDNGGDKGTGTAKRTDQKVAAPAANPGNATPAADKTATHTSPTPAAPKADNK